MGGGGDGGNNHRKDFMINLHKSYIAKLGFELETPGSTVRYATNCAMKPDPLRCLFSFVFRDH